MPEMSPPAARARPGTMRLVDALQYRLPPAGIVSILHRVSGSLMFLLLPFIVWLLDVSLSSEISYEQFTAAFGVGIGVVPGWLVKLVVLALIWAYLHHFIAGNYGSKRIVTGAHYGLRDWLSQRVTAALMALFTLVVLAQVIFTSGPVGYDQWAGIFASQWMKVLTFAVIVALLWHV